MKKYRVNVNGKDFEVTIEQIEATDIKTEAATTKQAAPTNTVITSTTGEKITSPMPGNILGVHISQGDQVKKGQVLMILEAMKMENEIMSPKDGVVASLNTSKGAAVESGALLCVIQ